MRNEYKKLLFKKIKTGQISSLFNLGLKIPLIWLGQKIKEPTTGPIHAILIVTYRCNLRCRMCDLWRRPQKTRKKELSTKQFLAIINDLADLKTTGIGFTGGEPLLREDIFELISHANNKGLVTHLATNGTLLKQKEINLLFTSGLSAISVSLDGPTAGIHDQVRGKGSFDKTVTNIKRLIREKETRGSSLVISINCAISKFNLDKVITLVKKVPQIGIDGIGFIPVQESGLEERKKSFSKELKLSSIKKTNKVMDSLIEMKKNNPKLIDNSIGYLKLMKYFFSGRKLPINCLVGYHSCVVDTYGCAFFCIPFSNLDQPLGQVGKKGFKKLWRGKTYQKARDQKADCRQCFWNCHNEINLNFTRFKRS